MNKVTVNDPMLKEIVSEGINEKEQAKIALESQRLIKMLSGAVRSRMQQGEVRVWLLRVQSWFSSRGANFKTKLLLSGFRTLIPMTRYLNWDARWTGDLQMRTANLVKSHADSRG